ncbi:hypothetical protein NIES4071_12580 [Calothrix sp. NIES-4071]|nr:hypothetical protein NIES4071_12580 [Calothrix sp. NIES-4071]BAZ55598.1 hypothetical protein NIES4105_12540 [Calothrix sp. NIES-4105]
MASSDRSFILNLKLPSDHPELLKGLDIWLELGLISDSQVKLICREYCVCPLPLEITRERVKAPNDVEQKLVKVSPRVPQAALPHKQPGLVTSMVQSLMAELSVRWLLFLGMFLVVVSSGLLAASQWDRFPAVGQYGVLFAYTLSFFGASFWAGKQTSLRLTAQALLVVTQLLIPVNFWAIDGFKLWQSGTDVIFAVIASVVLTIITILIGNSSLFAANLPNYNLRHLQILGLSYLHSGWSVSGFPLVAVYIGMIGTSFLTVYQTLSKRENNKQTTTGITLPVSVIIYALLLLLFRAIFVVGIDITLLGLAIGICGWLATWLAMRIESDNVQKTSWQLVGTTLLFIGWAVSVITHPIQALAVSGLSLWYSWRRLQLYSYNLDYAVVFTIGLQANWLLWRIIPASLRSNIVTFAVGITNSQNSEWVLLSLGLFPYLVLMTSVTEYLRKINKLKVAKFGEAINLCFGVILASISFDHPTLRSLNLLLNTITLAVLTKRHAPHLATSLIYLTHITTILTFCSFINWRLPTLQTEYWAVILLVLMVAEWLYSVGDGVWHRSALHIGYGLAAVSFALLWSNASLYSLGYPQQDKWGLIWLSVPITLTAISSRTEATRRKILTLSSVLAIGTSQFLTLVVPDIRVISLGVATALMIINTKLLLKTVEFAIVTVGFALMFESALLWDVAKFNLLGNDAWLLVGAINVFTLWVGRAVLLKNSEFRSQNLEFRTQNSALSTQNSALSTQNSPLSTLYAAAFQKWALLLCGAELLLLTVHSVLVYTGGAQPGILYLAAIAITTAAILFRTWRQHTNRGFYGIGLGLELLVAEALAFSGRTTIKIAVANIALGLTAQLFGEWWKRRHRLEQLPNSFHVLPIIYAAFSVILRFNTFTSWTGLFTLGVAVIVIGVGRRYKSLKPLLYAGLIGVSISFYEMLFYQMLQQKGGYYGDGLIAMSALGAIILYAYRILSPWLTEFLHLTQLELTAIANFHWVWSSSLLLMAIASPLNINRVIGLGTGTFLVRYAIFQGRGATSTHEEIVAKEVWVYLGLIQAITLTILLRDLPIARLFTHELLPWNAAISCVGAYFLYILPWQRWGWSRNPWRNAAYVLPLLILSITWLQVYPVTILITACFYIFLAKLSNTFRLTYVSLILVDWALMRWFYNWRLDGLWYVITIGLSLLYIAQFDPEIKLPQSKTGRHNLRIIGSSIICGYALIFHQDTAIIPGILSLLAIFTGLALRIRAFLFVGTATFLITGIYQLVILSLRYTFMKWVIGLCVGIILISIAANFETRREQLSAVVRTTSDAFENWE